MAGRAAGWPAAALARGDAAAPRIGETCRGRTAPPRRKPRERLPETALPQDLLTGLDEFARRCGVPFKAVVLAAHLRVMSLVTGARTC